MDTQDAMDRSGQQTQSTLDRPRLRLVSPPRLTREERLDMIADAHLRWLDARGLSAVTLDDIEQDALDTEELTDA